jgi:6-phosphogluconolactonase (cycloisomerase 2 family)
VAGRTSHALARCAGVPLTGSRLLASTVPLPDDRGLDPGGLATDAGCTPRFIGLDPSNRFLYAANANADTIVTFAVEKATGRLTPTGQVIKNGSPVTIVFGTRP